jgi:hypothetical protein
MAQVTTLKEFFVNVAQSNHNTSATYTNCQTKHETHIVPITGQWIPIKKQICLPFFVKTKEMTEEVLDVYPYNMVHIDINQMLNLCMCNHIPWPVYTLLSPRRSWTHHLFRCSQTTSGKQMTSPSFIVPKKDRKVCWVSDIQQLDKVIK